MKAAVSGITASMGTTITKMAFESTGFLFREQPFHDVGIDAQIEIITDNNATGRLVGIQIKAGDSYFRELSGDSFVFRCDERHAKYWLEYTLPVIVVLVDTNNKLCYWQHVSEENLDRTGRDYKLLIPKRQILGAETHTALLHLASPAVSKDRYTLLCLNDCSHALTKRYTAKILLAQTLSRAEILAIARAATRQLKKETYNRNNLVANHWKNTPPHEVTLWVYPTLEDSTDANWICMSQWFDPEHPAYNHSQLLNGVDIGDGVFVDWSDSYTSRAELRRSSILPKSKYLESVDYIIGSLIIAVEEFDSLFVAGHLENPDSFPRSLKKLVKRVRNIVDKGLNLSYGPFECAEVGVRFNEMLISANNIVLPYWPEAMKLWEHHERVFLVTTALTYFAKSRDRLSYELEKVR